MPPDGALEFTPYVVETADESRELLGDVLGGSIAAQHLAPIAPRDLAFHFLDRSTVTLRDAFTPAMVDVRDRLQTLSDTYANVPAKFPACTLDTVSRIARAADAEADVFFGLLPGTNGTGPTMRRAHVPADFRWVTSKGKPASGIYLVPSDQSDDMNTNPWSGSPSSAPAMPQRRWAGLR